VRFDDSGDPPQILIGVEVAPDAVSLDAALSALAQAAGTEANLMPLRRDADDPISRFMRRQDSPFYASDG
jgi:hypothetical protein